ncbi:MAG: tetratricopeptide repeat protein [Chitinophagaceae bacterium]|nr:tetratricopeptide repeat protein [Chitinophagaceae bacterium]
MSKQKIQNEKVLEVKETKPSEISSSTPTTSNTWNKIFTGSLISVFLAMTVMSFWYGLSGDEVDMNEYGKAILKYFTSFFSDQTVFNMPKEYNRDGVIQYYGGLFDLICAIVNKISPLEEYTTRHILNAWAGFLAIFFAAKITVRVLNKQAGSILIWLMFLSPFFLGHAMNNPKDIPFAAAYIMAIYFIIRLFDALPAPTRKDYLWAILSIGATINIRVGGILLIPYLGVFAVILFIVGKYFRDEKVSLFDYAKPVIITGILGYFAGSLLWPYGLQNPISNPLNALSEMSNFKVNIRQSFEGTKVFSGELPIRFLPKSFVITNSYVVLLGLVLSLPFLWSFRKNKQAGILYFIGFTALFPLAYIIYGKSNVYHAWRHILFIFPSLMVVAAFGWEKIVAFFDARKIKMAGLGMMGFLMLEPLYFIGTTFPNTITYHNSFAGGVKGAYGNYEVDYYYNSLKQCADWFKKHELPKYKSTDTVKIYTNAAHLLTKYFTKEKNVYIDYIRYPERNQKYWDYVIFHIALIPSEELKSKNWLPPSTVYQAQVMGQTLCAVIKRPSFEDLVAFDYLQKNQPDSAIMHFDQYLSKDPKNTTILNICGNILMQTNRIESAAKYINQSYQLDTSLTETKQMYGMVKLQSGDFATAQNIFTQIVGQNPDYPRGYFYLAIAQMNLNNLQQALNNFNTASRDKEIQQACYKYMGDVYMKMGNQQEAMKLYQAAGVAQ